MGRTRSMLLVVVVSQLAAATLAHTSRPDTTVVPAPTITPSTTLSVGVDPSRTVLWQHRLERRDFLSSVDGYVNSKLSSVGSLVPSVIGSDIPDFFDSAFPTGTQVQQTLNVSNSQLETLPTAVLNFPPYANWTDEGWNVRFHGNIYRQPNTSLETLDNLADKFLINTSIDQLSPEDAAQARNVTSEIFIIQDSYAPAPLFSLAPAPLAGASGEQGGGGAAEASGGSQTVQFPYNATVEGDFDAFVPINSGGLMPGNATNEIQRLNVYTNGSRNGNATAYLVPPEGLTVVSDIDDILRITGIWDPAKIIDNTFAYPYTPFMNMPEVYANWSRNLNISNQTTHFHYLTTLPEQVTPNYEQFIYGTYPGGSFDTRPLNFTNLQETFSVRKFLLDKLFQTFPQRRFILVGDVSNSDIMKDYPAMFKQYPGQVQCIFLRNTTATDSSDWIPYTTEGFQGIPQNNYMFFITPNDLMNLDIANQQCYNVSVPQNLTFGYQNLPFGVETHNSPSAAASARIGSYYGYGMIALAGIWLAL